MFPNAQAHLPPDLGAESTTTSGHVHLLPNHGTSSRRQSQQVSSSRGTDASESPAGSSATPAANNRITRVGQPIRRRISRACDQCNSLRTKCNGGQPCEHCNQLGLVCEYARAKKKRGKASRKDVAAQNAEANVKPVTVSPKPAELDEHREAVVETPQLPPLTPHGIKRKRSSIEPNQEQIISPLYQPFNPAHGFPVANDFVPGFPTPEQHSQMTNTVAQAFSVPRFAGAGMADQIGRAMHGYGAVDVDDYHNAAVYPHPAAPDHHASYATVSQYPNSGVHTNGMTDYSQPPYAMAQPMHPPNLSLAPYVDQTPISTGLHGPPPSNVSPGWAPLPSQTTPQLPHPPHDPNLAPNHALRYPVLEPLIPHIVDSIQLDLACDLLGSYFASTSSVFLHPQSPYILGYVFRKQSFLRVNSPRPCSPALLASMLWVGAQQSDLPALTAQPSLRNNICQKLLDITIRLLQPLIHTSTDTQPSLDEQAEAKVSGLSRFGLPASGQAYEPNVVSPGASGTIDDVATYMHLATVVSASEYKTASLRWWNAAWTLARELRLGKEIPRSPGRRRTNHATHGYNLNMANGSRDTAVSGPDSVTEEEREERRRIWWLLYAMDRHLSLCYNRPIFLTDAECAGLLRPVNDSIWQTGNMYVGPGNIGSDDHRHLGPPFECNDHSMFGCFLPLMTILGQIIELNRARSHPLFGDAFYNSPNWHVQVQEISEQLHAYGGSLRRFEKQNNGPRQTPSFSPHVERAENSQHAQFHAHPLPNGIYEQGPGNQTTQHTMLWTHIVVAYGEYLMHTLYILLNGKWDPVSLLDDNDLWISTPSFKAAVDHSVAASEALDKILQHDPELSFMPFFFGMYLLQGSFLFLLIAEKLQTDAGPNVVKACETIVRAHEACIVTLSTEYQRNFRRVMRSALAQMTGRVVEDLGEQQKRRREVLALYRWTADGTGLAL